ncbi:MAG: hypothetical protein WCJ59_02255 [bacterium]
MQVAENKIYVLNEKPPTFYPTHLFRDIEAHQAARLRNSKNIAKILLKERISGRSIADKVPDGSSVSSGSSYLEYNAQTTGGKREKNNDFRYVQNLSRTCGKNSLWLLGQVSEDFYVKKIDCRKWWCPVCGGKGGKIHNSRLHAILRRFSLSQYNARQFVFTFPENFRLILRNRKNLSLAAGFLKNIIEKEFGEAELDKNGWVKRYYLKKGSIFYTHLFGERPGIYEPHFNVHILEDKKEKLKMSPDRLGRIKKAWLEKLKYFDESIAVVDVHYSFTTSDKKLGHRLKYMCRPASAADNEAITDDSLRDFLMVEMSGFQHLRFWGSLANCKYRDEMTAPEQAAEIENKAGEKLTPLFIAPFSYECWSSKLEQLDDGFYRVMKKDGAGYVDVKIKNENLFQKEFVEGLQ